MNLERVLCGFIMSFMDGGLVNWFAISETLLQKVNEVFYTKETF